MLHRVDANAMRALILFQQPAATRVIYGTPFHSGKNKRCRMSRHSYFVTARGFLGLFPPVFGYV